MGAWGSGNLENDSALDWLGDLEADPLVERVIETLSFAAAGGGYLEADEAQAALVGAELIAAAIGRGPGGPEGSRVVALAERWPELSAQVPLAELALTAVASDEGSELYELWHEDAVDSAEWDSVIDDLRDRLRGEILGVRR